MSDGDDFHKMSAIVDRIKDSIITNADPPSIPCADKLPAAGRAWVISQRSKGVNYAYSDHTIQHLDFFLRGTRKLDLVDYSTHSRDLRRAIRFRSPRAKSWVRRRARQQSRCRRCLPTVLPIPLDPTGLRFCDLPYPLRIERL